MAHLPDHYAPCSYLLLNQGKLLHSLVASGGVETNSFGIGRVAIRIPETNISSAVSRQRVLQNDDTSQQLSPLKFRTEHGLLKYTVQIVRDLGY